MANPERTIKIGVVASDNGSTEVVEKKYRSMLGRIQADVEKTGQAIKRSLSLAGGGSPRLEAAAARLSSAGAIGGAIGSRVDPAMQRAIADVRHYQQSSIQMERELTRQIEREARAQSKIRISEAKRANLEQIRALKQIENESAKAAKSSSSAFSQSLGGSFFGNLGGERRFVFHRQNKSNSFRRLRHHRKSR